ncbi:MAG: PIG-L family deacetylase [Pseudomonadota bacterium]
MRKLLKIIYKNMLPKRLLPLFDLFSEMRNINKSNDTNNEKNVLIIAPHMDDEIIACGGVMQQYIKAGAKVSVIFMTDGRHGNPNYDPDDLSLLRREESRQACEIIGVDDLIFLDNIEAQLKNTEDSRKVISDLLNIKQPDAVFFPLSFDGHKDHVATSYIVLSTVNDYNPSLTCYGYCVWSPLIPNLTVNITDDMDLKIKAMQVFKTQLEQFDLVDMTLSNSRYMSYVYGMWKGYSENFIVASAREHLRLSTLV